MERYEQRWIMLDSSKPIEFCFAHKSIIQRRFNPILKQMGSFFAKTLSMELETICASYALFFDGKYAYTHDYWRPKIARFLLVRSHCYRYPNAKTTIRMLVQGISNAHLFSIGVMFLFSIFSGNRFVKSVGWQFLQIMHLQPYATFYSQKKVLAPPFLGWWLGMITSTLSLLVIITVGRHQRMCSSFSFAVQKSQVVLDLDKTQH